MCHRCLADERGGPRCKVMSGMRQGGSPFGPARPEKRPGCMRAQRFVVMAKAPRSASGVPRLNSAHGNPTDQGATLAGSSTPRRQTFAPALAPSRQGAGIIVVRNGNGGCRLFEPCPKP